MKELMLMAFLLFSVPGAMARSPAPLPPVPCVEGGLSVRSARSDAVCASALPACEGVRGEIEARVRAKLSMKIYGYWRRKDLDLRRTSLKTAVGEDLPSGLCSVVGHQIRYQGAQDLEVEELRAEAQEFAKGPVNAISGDRCGPRPRFFKAGDRYRLAIAFDHQDGDRWLSYVRGAYPYEIRASAYRFFSKHETLEKWLKDLPFISKDFEKLRESARTRLERAYRELPDSDREACLKPGLREKLRGCLPAQGGALCRWFQAQEALELETLSDQITAQILAEASQAFDRHFGRLFGAEESLWKSLDRACRDSSLLDQSAKTARRKRLAAVASCLNDGDWFRVGESGDAFESNGNPKKNRKGRKSRSLRLDQNEPVWVEAQAPGHEAPFLRKVGSGDVPVTLTQGFESLIEYIIRHQVCGQNAVTDPSPLCEEGSIPDRPEGVEW